MGTGRKVLSHEQFKRKVLIEEEVAGTCLKDSNWFEFMQDMSVTLAATSTNALVDTNKNRRQSVNITLANIIRTHHAPCLSEQFHVLTKCTNKFD